MGGLWRHVEGLEAGSGPLEGEIAGDCVGAEQTCYYWPRRRLEGFSRQSEKMEMK